MEQKIKIGIAIGIVGLTVIFLGGIYFFYGAYPVGFQHGRIVVCQYFCSDVCPENGGWHTEYLGINSKEECEKIGGKPIIDFAWGGFIGCAPE